VATHFRQSEATGGVGLANANIPIASGRFDRAQASPLPLPLGHFMAARRRPGTDPRHEALAAKKYPIQHPFHRVTSADALRDKSGIRAPRRPRRCR